MGLVKIEALRVICSNCHQEYNSGEGFKNIYLDEPSALGAIRFDGWHVHTGNDGACKGYIACPKCIVINDHEPEMIRHNSYRSHFRIHNAKKFL